MHDRNAAMRSPMNRVRTAGFLSPEMTCGRQESRPSGSGTDIAALCSPRTVALPWERKSVRPASSPVPRHYQSSLILGAVARTSISILVVARNRIHHSKNGKSFFNPALSGWLPYSQTSNASANFTPVAAPSGYHSFKSLLKRSAMD